MDVMDLRRNLLMQALEMGVEEMKLIGTYTFQESWENDSIGNATNVFNTVLLPYIQNDNLGSAYNVYIAEFTNNTAPLQYRADFITAVVDSTASGTGVFTTRSNRTNRGQLGTNRSFYVSAGTIAKIYRLYDPAN